MTGLHANRMDGGVVIGAVGDGRDGIMMLLLLCWLVVIGSRIVSDNCYVCLPLCWILNHRTILS